MNATVNPVPLRSLEKADQARLTLLAPRPLRVSDTGLSLSFLGDLLAKHLLDRGALTIAALAEAMALTGSIVEDVLNFLRGEARIEVKPSGDGSVALRYELTDRGRNSALDAMLRSTYVGPAPVPLKVYASVARAQTVHTGKITRGAMRAAFEDVVLAEDLLDRIGPSLNSARAIFLHGPAGTGKTYISQRLSRLFLDLVLLPHAIVVDERIVEVFDPQVHKSVRPDGIAPDLMVDHGSDPRYHICERPVVITGGELSAEMLDVHFNETTRTYEAPLQLKANNGIFIIDDMGRQRISPEALFNRWIVPMEEKRDYLTLGAGQHFSVPFDVVLVFSTNIHPLELADEAFLRRIGYKIGFEHISPEQYGQIWRNTCREYRVAYDPNVLDYVLHELHSKENVPLLPCHPRDLLGMAVDYAAYLHDSTTVTIEGARWAWENYFVAAGDYDRSFGEALS